MRITLRARRGAGGTRPPAPRRSPGSRAGLAGVLALGLLVVAGCGGGGDGGGGDAAADRGGTLHVLSSLDLEHLDPARNYVTSSQDVGRLIYRTRPEMVRGAWVRGRRLAATA